MAHEQTRHLAAQLPNWIEPKPMRAFPYYDLGYLKSLSQYDAYGILGEFDIFRGISIKGRLAQRNHAFL